MSSNTSRLPYPPRPAADVVALEAHAERAGAAWACAYSSSAEFDAALIAARRAAGVYGPRRHGRQVITLAGVTAGLAVIVIVVNLIA
jgi:hypothetical protein